MKSASDLLFRKQWNKNITEPKEVAFVQGEISRRQEELSALEARLLAEREQLKSYETTAKALATKIDYAGRRLASHERYLADLLDLKKHLDQEGGTLDETKTVSDEIVRHQEEIMILAPKLKQMIQELHAQRIVYNASKTYSKALESQRKPLLDLLGGLKLAFNPIHIVPAEIWAGIFRYCLEEDVRGYLEASGRPNIRHTPVTLAQVCSFWREVVHTEKDLWRYFIYSPRRISDSAQVELWKHFCSFKCGSPTLITSLYGAASYAANTNPAVLVPSPTSAHVLTRGYYLLIPKTLPFNQAKSLTIEIDVSPTLKFMNGVGSAFPNATSRTIICSTHLPQLATSLCGRQATSLKMDLLTFDSFGINYYGYMQSLEELHIRHNGVNFLAQLGTAEGKKLRVLGITPPDNVWIETLRFPLLRQLVIYGPKTQTVATPQLLKLSQHPDFPRVRELGVLNWPMYTPPDAPSWSIMPLILAIADQLRLVETIRCANSFIEGECLVTLVKRLTDTTTNQSPSNLKMVVIDCCSGITRRDCELIAASVEKLVVYV
jgi:hypothetical protein